MSERASTNPEQPLPVVLLREGDEVSFGLMRTIFRTT
jgi:hypothetical protein